jgi:hypothetical protein
MAASLFARRPGVGVAVSTAPDADPVAEARDAEALGFDVISVHCDVLSGPPPSLEPGPC